jgi:hypothetical protein
MCDWWLFSFRQNACDDGADWFVVAADDRIMMLLFVVVVWKRRGEAWYQGQLHTWIMHVLTILCLNLMKACTS